MYILQYKQYIFCAINNMLDSLLCTECICNVCVCAVQKYFVLANKECQHL